MKTLQSNYTTLEQSKRLLELGVPADSADCYLEDCTYRVKVIPTEKGDTYSTLKRRVGDVMFLPCWSVGRLIEIFEICTGLVWENEVIDGYSKIDMLLEDFEDVEKKYTFNFSKLEE